VQPVARSKGANASPATAQISDLSTPVAFFFFNGAFAAGQAAPPGTNPRGLCGCVFLPLREGGGLAQGATENNKTGKRRTSAPARKTKYAHALF
jgi:hypothetical protein